METKEIKITKSLIDTNDLLDIDHNMVSDIFFEDSLDNFIHLYNRNEQGGFNDQISLIIYLKYCINEISKKINCDIDNVNGMIIIQ